MSTNDTLDEYETAPPVITEIAAVIELAAGFQGYEPTASEFHELALRRAALLDRIAEQNPDDEEAPRLAGEAALDLVRLVESETRPDDDGDPVAGDGWTLVVDAAGWTWPPRLYVRAEYARWSAAANADGRLAGTDIGHAPYLVGPEAPDEL